MVVHVDDVGGAWNGSRVVLGAGPEGNPMALHHARARGGSTDRGVARGLGGEGVGGGVDEEHDVGVAVRVTAERHGRAVVGSHPVLINDSDAHVAGVHAIPDLGHAVVLEHVQVVGRDEGRVPARTGGTAEQEHLPEQ